MSEFPGTVIAADEALRKAQADASQAYRDLRPYWIRVALESDGWHVDYKLKTPESRAAARTTSSTRKQES